MPRAIQYNNIEYFYHTCTEGGYHAAARKLACSPSAVKEAVASLEHDLGCRLFVYAEAKLVPTAEGREYFGNVAVTLVEGTATFRQRAGAQPGVPRKVIASPHLTLHYLSKQLERFRAGEPDLAVLFEEVPRDEIEARIQQRRAHLGVVTTDAPPPGLKWQLLTTVQPVFVVREDSGITNVDTLLRGRQPWHLIRPPAAEGVCRRVQPLLDAYGVTWARTTGASSTAHVPWLVAAMKGTVGLSVAANSLAKAGTRVLKIPVEPLLVGAIWLGPGTPRLRRALDLLAQAARTVK